MIEEKNDEAKNEKSSEGDRKKRGWIPDLQHQKSTKIRNARQQENKKTTPVSSQNLLSQNAQVSPSSSTTDLHSYKTAQVQLPITFVFDPQQMITAKPIVYYLHSPFVIYPQSPLRPDKRYSLYVMLTAGQDENRDYIVYGSRTDINIIKFAFLKDYFFTL